MCCFWEARGTLRCSIAASAACAFPAAHPTLPERVRDTARETQYPIALAKESDRDPSAFAIVANGCLANTGLMVSCKPFIGERLYLKAPLPSLVPGLQYLVFIASWYVESLFGTGSLSWYEYCFPPKAPSKPWGPGGRREKLCSHFSSQPAASLRSRTALWGCWWFPATIILGGCSSERGGGGA